MRLRCLPGPPARLLAACAAVLLALLPPALAGAPDLPLETRLAIETDRGERFEFQVELAATPRTRARGLMFRTHLAPDRGMLFDFGVVRPVSMWMRNTYIPLDMLFIEEDGEISHIAENTRPLSERSIPSRGPVRAVLELRAGRAAELGIRPGDRVHHPIFSRSEG